MKRCSSRELAEWIAYDSIEPFGALRGDLGNAIVACTIANVNSKRKYKPKDFMPYLDKPKDEGWDWQAFQSQVKGMSKRGNDSKS